MMLVVPGEAADPALPCFRQHLQYKLIRVVTTAVVTRIPPSEDRPSPKKLML
jgi:hypothetical protein